MAARQVSGVDRALARFRQIAAETEILRHVVQNAQAAEETSADMARGRYEVPDRLQLRGAPVIVLRTPAWPREDWAVPQRPRRR